MSPAKVAERLDVDALVDDPVDGARVQQHATDDHRGQGVGADDGQGVRPPPAGHQERRETDDGQPGPGQDHGEVLDDEPTDRDARGEVADDRRQTQARGHESEDESDGEGDADAGQQCGLVWHEGAPPL